MLKRIWWLRLLILLLLGGTLTYGTIRYAAWSRQRTAMDSLAVNKAVAVTVQPPRVETVKQSVPMVGTVQSQDALTVAAVQSGSVIEVDTALGRSVKAGDVLAKLDASAQTSALLEAEANLRIAQAKYEQQTSVNQNEVSIAKDNVAVAQAKVDLLKKGTDPAELQKVQEAYHTAEDKIREIEQSIAFEKSPQSPDSLTAAKDEAALKALQDGTSPVNTSNNNTELNQEFSLQAAENNLQTIQNAASSYGQAVANAQTELDNAQQALDEYMTANNVTASVYSNDPKLSELQAAVTSDQEALDLAKAKWNDAIASARNDVYQKQEAMAGNYQLGQSQQQASQQTAQDAVNMANANQTAALEKLNQQLADAEDAAASALDSLHALQEPPNPDALQQAEANLQAAESRLQETEHPADPGTTAELSASVDLAKTKVVEARNVLDQMTIRAPFAGTVTACNVVPGSLVRSGGAMFTLMGNVKELTAQVDEQHLGAVRIGDKASFALAADPAKAYSAKVVGVSPTADTQSLTFNVVLLPADASVPLIPGETASIRVAVQDIPNALMIPSAAIVNVNGHPQVYVATANHKAALRDVQTGYSDGSQTQITSGLTAQDEVITMGQTYLAAGDNLKIEAPDGSPALPPAEAGKNAGNKAGKSRKHKKNGAVNGAQQGPRGTQGGTTQLGAQQGAKP